MGIISWVTLFLTTLAALSWLYISCMVEHVALSSYERQAAYHMFEERFKDVSDRGQIAYDMCVPQAHEGQQAPIVISDLPEQAAHAEEGEAQDEVVPRNERGLPYQRGQDPQKLASKRAELKLTRQLHLNALFSGENDEGVRKNVETVIVQRILQRTYGDLLDIADIAPHGVSREQFYRQFLDKIVTKIGALKDKLSFKESSRLAEVQLEESADSYLLYRILVGGHVFMPGKQSHVFPALSGVITFRKRPTICSLYLAPNFVVSALTDTEEGAASILKERRALYNKIRKSSKEELTPQAREQLRNEFREKISSSISNEIDPVYIDFSVSKTEPP